MHHKTRLLPWLAAFCGLTSLFSKPEATLAAITQQNEKASQNAATSSDAEPELLPAALAEYLYYFQEKLPAEQKDSFHLEWIKLTPVEREDKVTALYRAAHNGKNPPNLAYAKTKELFANYPANYALSEVVQMHERSIYLFRATWFPDDHLVGRPGGGHPEYSTEMWAEADGDVWSLRHIRNWADQGIAEHAASSASIHQALKMLPPSETSVPLDRILILTFRTEKGWETRLYDRSHLSLRVSNLFDIAAERNRQRERPEITVEQNS